MSKNTIPNKIDDATQDVLERASARHGKLYATLLTDSLVMAQLVQLSARIVDDNTARQFELASFNIIDRLAKASGFDMKANITEYGTDLADLYDASTSGATP